MDEKIIQVICQSLDMHRCTFDKDLFERNYIHPMKLLHHFVVNVLNCLGVDLETAKKLSEDRTLEFVNIEIKSNKELYAFVEQRLLPLIKDYQNAKDI